MKTEVRTNWRGDLSDSPACADLSPAELEVLLAIGGTRVLEPGDVLFTEGEWGHDLALLLEGQLLVETVQAGKLRELARVDAPAVMGEIGLALDAPRSATVRALCQARVFVLDGDELHRKVRSRSSAALGLVWNVLRLLSRRQLLLNRHLLKLLEAEEPRFDMREFAARLNEWAL